jgi:plasmid maintenance system antidote protein VapI
LTKIDNTELTKIDNTELTKIDNLIQITLSEALQKMTLTTSEIAQKSEISKHEVSNYKAAKRAVSLEKSLLIASKLGIGNEFVNQLAQAMQRHLNALKSI